MGNILITGYTDWVREETIKTAFPDDTCILTGKKGGKHPDGVRFTDVADLADRAAVHAFFGTYEFDEIFFFSEGTALFGGTDFKELRYLADLLEESKALTSPRIVMAFGVNRSHIDSPMEGRLLDEAEKSLIKTCSHDGIDFMFLRIPWIYSISGDGADPRLRDFITSGGKEGALSFPVPASQEISLIPADDLAVFLSRLRDRWVPEDTGKREITISRPVAAKDLGDRLTALFPEFTCKYADQHSSLALPQEDPQVRESFSWFQQHGILDDLDSLGDRLREKNPEEKKRSFSFLSRPEGAAGKIRMFAELAAGFLIMEALLRINMIQVQFRLIDLRLLFIMIFGLMYNIPVGLCAAALSSVSLIIAYSSQGVSWLTLFYEPTNWFVFIIYFTLGAVCGYIRSKDREDLRFAAEESELLRNKYHFLRKLFLEAQQEKHEYRQQIISSEDSFGKIFRITQQLDVISPHLIYMHAMSVIEEIMANHTVTIYSVGHNKAFARLEASSRDMDARRSLSLQAYEDVLADIRESGIWINSEARRDMPMYVCGVVRGREIVLLVMIWDAAFGQMTLYYSNLLKILTGLISTSLLRSYDYLYATRASRYYEGTSMLKPEALYEEIETAYSMNQAKIASYSLHRLTSESMTPEEISSAIASRIRENDILGLKDDTLYLLLSQSTPEGVSIMRDRFEGLGIALRDADFEETAALLAPAADDGEEQP